MNTPEPRRIPEPLASISPATQLREHIIHYLNVNQPEMPLLAGKVRKLWDVSGDMPQGNTGIVVSCEDLGGHNGMPGRLLVDVRVNIRIFTNLDEDDTGVLLDNLESETMRLLAGMQDPDLKDWIVRFQGSWTITEPTNPRDNMRCQVISTTMFLQSKNI